MMPDSTPIRKSEHLYFGWLCYKEFFDMFGTLGRGEGIFWLVFLF